MPNDQSISSWPSEVGNYEILAKLGEGGMGAVFRARHQNLGKTVALKLLPLASLFNPDTVARFYREMSAVGAVEHENVVKAIDAGECSGFHYLVMEYVEGADLKVIAKAIGTPDPPTAAEIVRRAALGLWGIQKVGLVHRDIKPSNLFLTTDGVVKLLDLGLAKFAHPDNNDSLTSENVALGTPDFIAPEQAENSRSVDIRTDIYSLGCTLYALLCGHAPYDLPAYDSWPKKLIAHCKDPAPPLPNAQQIDSGLIEVMNRCLEKDPANRFQTPSELVAAITPFCVGSDTWKYAQEYAHDLAGDASSPEASIDTLSLANKKQPTTEFRQNPSPTTKTRQWFAVGVVATVLFATAVGGIIAPTFFREDDAVGNMPVTPTNKSPVEELAEDTKYDLPILPDAQRPTKSEAAAAVFDDAPVHEIQSLLTRPPCRGVEIDSEGVADWKYEAGGNKLTVSSGEYSLFQLGVITSDSYDLQVNIFESNWRSGAGIFFGLQKDGDSTWKFQYLRFSTANVRRGGFGAELVRGIGTLTDEKGKFSCQLLETGSQEISHSLDGEQRLFVGIKSGVIDEVVIRSEDLPNLKLPNAVTPKGMHKGAFGTFSNESQSVFRNVELTRRP